MRTSRLVIGLMLLAFVAGRPAFGGGDKDEPAEARKEVSVVPHDSKTHGALQVMTLSPKPADWFDVLQNGKRAFAGTPPRLNGTIELVPGNYVVRVNRTERKVKIEAGKKTVLWAGELVVEGKGGDWYAPYQLKERRLAGNPPPLNRPVALFAGTYAVVVRAKMMDKDLGEARVTPGRRTVLKY